MVLELLRYKIDLDFVCVRFYSLVFFIVYIVRVDSELI